MFEIIIIIKIFDYLMQTRGTQSINMPIQEEEEEEEEEGKKS
jgi:hypothetical protein